mmetsp:Transcript_30044/g.26623  ORF Transcript_30044/g.26623 Transcript_30044/m.26623 type:complete len:92 (+) Transcript_30044:38-313(+)
MMRPVKNQKDMQEYMKERHLASKWRDAISHCKAKIDTDIIADIKIDEDQRTAFEKCLTQDYLLKHGLDYFGNRDFLVIDMIGSKDLDLVNN